MLGDSFGHEVMTDTLRLAAQAQSRTIAKRDAKLEKPKLRPPVPICAIPLPVNPNQPTLPAIDAHEGKSRATELDELAYGFVTKNPWFWKLFVRFVHDAVGAGAKIGAKAVCERIRWEYLLRESLQRHDFAVNNTLAASIARIYTRTYPEHAGIFEMRVRHSERTAAHGGLA